MRLITYSFVSVLGLILSSCATSSSTFVEEAKTFAITRGSIVSVRNLTSDAHKRLSDGVAITVTGTECEVDMKLAAQTQTIALAPGWILIYSADQDYVLQPYQPPKPAKAETPQKADTPAKAAAPPKAESPAPPQK